MKRTLIYIVIMIFFSGLAYGQVSRDVKLGKYKSQKAQDCYEFVPGDEELCDSLLEDDRDLDGKIDQEDLCPFTYFAFVELTKCEIDKDLKRVPTVRNGIPSDVIINGIDMRYFDFYVDSKKAIFTLPDGAPGKVPGAEFSFTDVPVGIPGSAGYQVKWLMMDGDNITLLVNRMVDGFGCAPGDRRIRMNY